jgi:hypothetical protein
MKRISQSRSIQDTPEEPEADGQDGQAAPLRERQSQVSEIADTQEIHTETKRRVNDDQ